MAIELDKMSAQDQEVVRAAAKSILAQVKAGVEKPTIPPEVAKWAADNGMTLEVKKPAQMAAVDPGDAILDPANLAADGIGPQAEKGAAPTKVAIQHEATKREMKDFKIAHAIGILTLGADYPLLAQAGLEIEVLRDQKARQREPMNEEARKQLVEKQTMLKDLNLGSEVAGSFHIPHEVHAEMIEKLRGQEIFMRMGVTYLPNSPKTQEWTKEGRDPLVYWPGDTPSSDLTTSDTDYGDLTLTLHEMATVVPIRLNLIKHAVGSVEDQVRSLIVKAMALEQTRVGLRGTGAKQPLGITNQPAMSTYTSSSIGVPTFDTLLDKITLMKGRDAVIDPSQSAWIMHADFLGLFQKAKTGTAEYSYIMDLTNMPAERILGLPVFTSSKIRTDMGVGANESQIILVGNVKSIVLADGGETELTILKELYRLQMKIGVLAAKEIDFGIFREEELQILSGCTTS